MTRGALLVVLVALGVYCLPSCLPTPAQQGLESVAATVSHLLGVDASFNGVTSYRPLHLASVLAKESLIPFLVRLGADVNAVDSKNATALHYAASRGHGWAVDVLLSEGADAEAKTVEGETAEDVLKRLVADSASAAIPSLRALSTHRQQQALLRNASLTSSTVMTFEPVERRNKKDLSFAAFYNEYSLKRKPVVITGGMADALGQQVWTRPFIRSMCGERKVTVMHHKKGEYAWGNLVQGNDTTISEFLDNPGTGMVFDWSLPLNCRNLLKNFTMPKYFASDLLQFTNDTTVRNAWPSLFIAPAGTRSGLHIDAFGSSFWMLMLEGHKKWRFFDVAETPKLYPKYWSRSFVADVYEPDYERFPLLRLARGFETVLEPGDLLFVPANTPHQVANLDDNMAISGNFIDGANYEVALEEIYYDSFEDSDRENLLHELKKVTPTVDMNQTDMPYKDWKWRHIAPSTTSQPEEKADLDTGKTVIESELSQ